MIVTLHANYERSQSGHSTFVILNPSLRSRVNSVKEPPAFTLLFTHPTPLQNKRRIPVFGNAPF